MQMCFLVASFIRKAKSNKNAEIIVLLQKNHRLFSFIMLYRRTQLYSLVYKALLALVEQLVKMLEFLLNQQTFITTLCL